MNISRIHNPEGENYASQLILRVVYVLNKFQPYLPLEEDKEDTQNPENMTSGLFTHDKGTKIN